MNTYQDMLLERGRKEAAFLKRHRKARLRRVNGVYEFRLGAFRVLFETLEQLQEALPKTWAEAKAELGIPAAEVRLKAVTKQLRATASAQPAAKATVSKERRVRDWVASNQGEIVEHKTSRGFLYSFRPSVQKRIAVKVLFGDLH